MDQWKKENNVFWMGHDLNQNIWCILQDVRGFWVLDSSLKVKEFRKAKLENGELFNGSIYKLYFYGKTSAWCLTDRGLFRFNIVSNKMKRVDFPRISNELFGSYWIKQMIKLHDGSLLFSTLSGLYRINGRDGHENIQLFSELNNLPFRSFNMIYEDREYNIYVKDIDNNFYILGTSGGIENYKIKKSINFTGSIVQIYEYGNNIYLASNQGLFILKKNNFSIEKLFVNEVLPFTGIDNVLVEKDKIWLFGDRGLYYYNISEKTGRLFTDEDGLPSNKFNETCMVHTPEGRCIAGTKNGLVSFYPGKLNDIIYPPRAQLINMYVNDSSKSFIANPQETSKVDLKYYQNTFSFDFACIGFQHAASSIYEYRLDKYDENWIRSETTHYTRYSKMPPGIYNFHLRVIDVKGNVSPFVKTLTIEIKKAFWQTIIFKVLMGALLGFLIWIIIKWYLGIRIHAQQREFEKQQAIEKERTRIATDMHDDLGAGLSSIRFISEKVKRDSVNNVTKGDIDKILVSSSELIDKMNEIVWAMNEKNDSLGDLLFYIRSYAMEYCEENGIQCGFELSDNIPDIFVSGEIRRNVFLTIKESLHNVVKHSEATRVDIEFQSISGLYAVIRDNGKGIGSIEIRRGTSGNGLKNMRKRIESIEGNFRIYNRQGMVIEISVPLRI
jgi:signal transduction histidine kinase